MTRTALFLALALVTLLAALPADAQCYADYKAKQDNPLRLHYGVAQVSGACAPGDAERELRPRLARAGWELLNVMGVFGPEGLDERRNSAGQHFLRY
ncbi:MAG: hypothetical protein AAF646_09190 [Pseudomonadota bacterium]